MSPFAMARGLDLALVVIASAFVISQVVGLTWVDLRLRFGAWLSAYFLASGGVGGACIGWFLQRQGWIEIYSASRYKPDENVALAVPLGAVVGVIIASVLPRFILRAAEWGLRRGRRGLK